MKEQTILSLCERTFDPKSTMFQLIHFGKEKYDTWNVHKCIQCVTNKDNEVVGMTLKLDHENYKDFIFITLSWDDTYRVRFFDQRGEEVEDISMLYFDQLFEVIDRRLNEFVRFEVCLN